MARTGPGSGRGEGVARAAEALPDARERCTCVGRGSGDAAGGHSYLCWLGLPLSSGRHLLAIFVPLRLYNGVLATRSCLSFLVTFIQEQPFLNAPTPYVNYGPHRSRQQRSQRGG